jgi:3-oxoacyl-[acyl-carrier-protein] synthase II
MRRVAVTGVGLVTPLGRDAKSSWHGLTEGRSAIRRIEGLDPAQDKVVVAAALPDAEAAALAEALPPDARERTARFVHYAVAAAAEALEQAGHPNREASERFGVIAGVGIGVPHPSEGYRVGPTTIIRVMPNAAAAWIAIQNRLQGPNLCVSTACASGAHAIGMAFDQVRTGRALGMVAGGVDTVVTRDVLRAYAWMRALNTAKGEEPTRMSRPFDATRRGFVLGEGAGFMLLEDMDHATARGASILAEMLGYAANSDAYSIVAVAPEGEGMIRVMRDALEDSGVSAEAIDYVSAHGTSTKMNDREETLAIRRVFGPHANRILVSSQKSMLGHCMGGAGGIEAVVTVLSIAHQIATPTINLDHPDPECDLDYVPHRARPTSIRAALSNSFGFGGHNACLAYARADAH